MGKRGYVFCFLAVIALQGCMEKDLTPEQKAYVASLETELAQTKQDIDAGTRSAAAYSLSLIHISEPTRPY